MALKEGKRIAFKNETDEVIKGGSLVNKKGFYGVVYKDTEPNKEGVIEIEGVFEVAVSNPNEEIKSGDKLTFDNGKVKKATGQAKAIGKAFEDKPAGKETIKIKLMPSLY